MADADRSHRPPLENRIESLGYFWSATKFVLLAFIIMLPIRWFVAQPFIISGSSMIPTFDVNEYVVIDKLTYYFQPPHRGDIIVFRYPLDPSLFFIKRVVGLPGEVVDIKDGILSVHSVSDKSDPILKEPYIIQVQKKEETSTITLGPGEYFVLGDNRDESSDSREWGPLQDRFIIGRVVFRFLPLDKAGMFPGEYNFAK